MSDPSTSANAPSSEASPSLDRAGAAEKRLVETLRERYRPELAREGLPARPFELRLADRSRWRIGEGKGPRPQRDDHAWLRRHGRPVVGRGGLVPTGDREAAQ